MVDITAASAAFQYLRDFSKWVGSLRTDAEVLSRTNEAMREVGAVQDMLYELRDENYRLQDENRKLAEKLRDQQKWEQRKAGYQLVNTPGNATVLQSTAGPVHYACPACVEARSQLQLLQDMDSASECLNAQPAKSHIASSPAIAAAQILTRNSAGSRAFLSVKHKRLIFADLFGVRPNK